MAIEVQKAIRIKLGTLVRMLLRMHFCLSRRQEKYEEVVLDLKASQGHHIVVVVVGDTWDVEYGSRRHQIRNNNNYIVKRELE